MGNFTFNNELVDNSQSAHSSFKRFVILVVMILMTASSVFANDVLEDIDGLTYRLNLKTKTATLCNRYYNDYSGDIVVPDKVEYYGATYSVVAYQDGCFGGCTGLTSITIPSSVTSLGGYCFSGCNNLETLFFKGKTPEYISNASINTICVFYVFAEYLQDYKDALGADYKYIYAWNPDESGNADNPTTKCATPSISYELGELKIACETPGAKYRYTISDNDMAKDVLSEDGKVYLSAAYKISAYATAIGYIESDKTEATLYWIKANLEDITNINQVKKRCILASVNSGVVSISGLYNGEEVKFFAPDGKYIGSAVAATNGVASCALSESLVIAKVGNNSFKISIK